MALPRVRSAVYSPHKLKGFILSVNMNLETVNQGHTRQFQNNRQVLGQLKPWVAIISYVQYLALNQTYKACQNKIKIWRKIKFNWHTKYYPDNRASAQGFIAILNRSWWRLRACAGWFLLTWHKLRNVWSQQRNNLIRSPVGKSGEHFCD